jgi:hypothetical protein
MELLHAIRALLRGSQVALDEQVAVLEAAKELLEAEQPAPAAKVIMLPARSGANPEGAIIGPRRLHH